MSERRHPAGEWLSLEDAVGALRRQFVQRTDCYPIQLASGSYVTVYHPLELSQLEAHLRGEITLGTYLLAPDSTGRFLVFDADTPAAWQQLVATSQALLAEQMPSYLEVSRRGGHLWLFLSHPRPGAEIRAFGRGVMHTYALANVELYPKQDVLQEGPGSLIRMPLGVHRTSGKRYGFYTPYGVPLAGSVRAQVQYLQAPQTVSTADFNRFQLTIPKAATEPILPTLTSSEGHISERIKRAISVYEFVGQFVELTESGRGLCPFHDDRVKSFSVNRDRNYWHCFAGCGGGSIIDFWMRYRRCDFRTAISELATQLL